MTLADLKIGQDAVLRTIGGQGELRHHLLDMGLTPGSQALPSFGSTWNASRTICSAMLPQYIRSVLWVFMSVNM